MALDPQQVEALVKLFQQKYPHWQSFSSPADPAFEQDEIHYKRRLVQRAQECLKAEDLCQLLLKREPDKIADFLTRLESLGTSSNLLFRTNPAAGDLNILYHPNLDKTALGEALLDLLYGEDLSEQRLTRYLNFVVSQNLPNKWTFPTYFLFLWQPRTEIFIKPASMKRFLAFLGLGDRFSSTPTTEGYGAIKQLAHDLKAALQPYEPRDMVDIQSFIWVCTNVLAQSQSYWKIAPGEEAWQWEECRQAGFIAVGWDEMGDISGLTQKQFEERHQAVLAQQPDLSEGWSKAGLKQLWKFANIKVNDRIIANRGTQEILGIGTVTGAYYFVPHTQQGHRLPVRWDDTKIRAINEPSWVQTLREIEPEKFQDMCDGMPPTNQDSPRNPRAAWLFQCKPSIYDLPSALGKLASITWLVNQHKANIHAGDEVFLWEAGSNAGLLAKGTVTTEPSALPLPLEEHEFSQDAALAPPQLRVKISIQQVFEKRILKQVLLGDPILQDLSVLRAPQGTNFPVTPEQANALNQLITRWHRPIIPSLNDIQQQINCQGLRIDERTLRRYHLALQTRKFVILSGISGTGKTWLTQAYAQAVNAEYCLVPVAPNWTTNEDLLGYFNPMNQHYVDTGFSHFLRQAANEYQQYQDQARPYHLVLDEMNLARVEYYFAKFLSAMEVQMRDGSTEIELSAHERVLLTPNLHFIGTINVDESTHGFADKIYDRAQLIELQVDRNRLHDHLGPVPYRDVLMQIWDYVHPVAPFAFRVLDEIKIYVGAAEKIGCSWQEAFDEQLLQKVLPKFRGADPRVGDALHQMMQITQAKDLMLSHAKASQMLHTFRLHGFTSYF